MTQYQTPRIKDLSHALDNVFLKSDAPPAPFPNMKRAIITICLILALVGITDAKGRKHRKATPRPPIISQAEKRQLLRSFTDEQIKAELSHRLLTLYTLEELQVESEKRERVK